jgi:hypothetical protein
VPSDNVWGSDNQGNNSYASDYGMYMNMTNMNMTSMNMTMNMNGTLDLNALYTQFSLMSPDEI